MDNIATPTITTPGPIVLVDDDDTEFYLLKKYAERAGLTREVTHFDNGFDFIKYIKEAENNAHSTPALVLLDIRMPGMDGFAVLEQVNLMPNIGNKLNIIVFTNSLDRRDMERAASLNASSYRNKPVNMADYIAFLQQTFPEGTSS